MSGESAFDRAAAIFAELMEVPREDRGLTAELLAGKDGAVLELVGAMLDGDVDADQPLDHPVVQLPPEVEALASKLPETVGPYKILALLGEGGMGVVLEAQQSSPSRRVALKLLRGGALDHRVLKRFEHEARVLGSLNHPGIAQVFEAGIASGGGVQQPYIAMELVRGVPMEPYAEAHSLGLTGRLQLLADLCEAVHHAHQKGVVHRDLKPANVIVNSEGQVKVLDFGIARFTDSDRMATYGQTMTGQVLGTLPYMSPEQVNGDPAKVDIRTDVYALGVMAYELLSGQRPIALAGRSLPEAARMISEHEPTTLGHFDRRLRGDIEVIVGRALSKERERRYESAGEMAEDIRRHLRDEPILARAPSTSYQLKKFVRRNRLFVFASSTIVLLSIGFGVTMAVQAKRVAAQRDLAERKTALSKEVADFLVELFRVAEPEGIRANQLTARQVLEIGSKRITTKTDLDPQLRSELLLVMGRTFAALGVTEEASKLLDEAYALRTEQKQGPEDLAEVQLERALVNREFGHQEEALGTLEALRAELLPRAGDYRELLFQVRVALASTYLENGAYQESLAEAETLVKDAQAWYGSDSIQASNALFARGKAQLDLANYAEAEADIQSAAEQTKQRLSEDHPGYLAMLRTLGDMHMNRCDWDKAVAVLTKVLDLDRQVFGDDHPNVDGDLYLLASTYSNMGDTGRALELFREVHQRDQENLGDHPYVALDQTEIAALLGRRGEIEAAWEMFESGFAMQKRLLAEDHPELGTTLANMGVLAVRTKDPAKALEYFQESLRIRLLTLPPDHPEVVNNDNSVGVALLELKRFDEAETILRRVLATREAALGEHPDVASTMYSLAACLDRQGKEEEAAQVADCMLGMMRRVYPANSLNVARALHLRASMWMRAEAPLDALPLYTECLAIRTDQLIPTDPVLLTTQLGFANCLSALDRFDEAEPHFGVALQGLQSKLGADHGTFQSAYSDYQAACSRAGKEPQPVPPVTQEIDHD